jgi:hypothetical protein
MLNLKKKHLVTKPVDEAYIAIKVKYLLPEPTPFFTRERVKAQWTEQILYTSTGEEQGPVNVYDDLLLNRCRIVSLNRLVGDQQIEVNQVMHRANKKPTEFQR